MQVQEPNHHVESPVRFGMVYWMYRWRGVASHMGWEASVSTGSSELYTNVEKLQVWLGPPWKSISNYGVEWTLLRPPCHPIPRFGESLLGLYRFYYAGYAPPLSATCPVAHPANLPSKKSTSNSSGVFYGRREPKASRYFGHQSLSHVFAKCWLLVVTGMDPHTSEKYLCTYLPFI